MPQQQGIPVVKGNGSGGWGGQRCHHVVLVVVVVVVTVPFEGRHLDVVLVGQRAHLRHCPQVVVIVVIVVVAAVGGRPTKAALADNIGNSAGALGVENGVNGGDIIAKAV